MKYKLFLYVFLLCIGCNRKEFLNPNDPLNFPSAPVIGYPTANTVAYDNPPTFIWGCLDTVPVICEIQGAYNSNFNNPIFSELVECAYIYGDTLIFYYIPDSLLGKQFFWRVRAKGEDASDEAWCEWSSPISFTERFPLVGEFDIGDYANRIVIKDNYAYVFYSGGNTFHILDLSNPTNPELLASFTDSAVYEFYDILKEGDYLYSACYMKSPYSYGLKIYSVSEPASPQFTGVCPLSSSYVYGIDISYPAVYVTNNYNSYIEVVDVSDPTHPQVRDTIFESVYNNNFAVKGEHLILSTYSGMKIYDITDPFTPYIENSYSIYPDEFCISGDTLVTFNSPYYSDSAKITIFNISALPVLQAVDSFSVSYYGFYNMCFSNNCVIMGRCIVELKAGYGPREAYLGYPCYSDMAVNKGCLYSIYEGKISIIQIKDEDIIQKYQKSKIKNQIYTFGKIRMTKPE